MGVRQQKSQYARVIFPCGSDQSAIGSLLVHRGSAVQSLVSRSKFLQSESSATGCGYAMPHHLSTLYQERKNPVEISLPTSANSRS